MSDDESKTRTTRLKGDLDERYQSFRDRNDMTDSEAMRSLVRKGLNADSTNEGYQTAKNGLIAVLAFDLLWRWMPL